MVNGNDEREAALPLFRVIAERVGTIHELERRGGPVRETLNKLRRGGAMRGDSVRRLAMALGLTFAEARALVDETTSAVRAARLRDEGASS